MKDYFIISYSDHGDWDTPNRYKIVYKSKYFFVEKVNFKQLRNKRSEYSKFINKNHATDKFQTRIQHLKNFIINNYALSKIFHTVEKAKQEVIRLSRYYREYSLYGFAHSKYGPAYIDVNKSRYYYYKGKLHRDNGPAIIALNGTTQWYQHGEKHRIDGPASIWSDHTGSYEEYHQNGRLHRDDGPAVVFPFKREWYRHGKIHKEDGPASFWKDGSEYWYINGKSISISVKNWIEENDLPPYTEWDDNIWVLFKLKFV